MFPTIFLLIAAISAPGQDPTPQPPAEKPVTSEKEMEVPWVPGTTEKYRWILDGQEVGRTEFSVERTDQHWVLTSTWTYSARGRQFSAKSKTLLDRKTLEPRKFEQDQKSVVPRAGAHTRRVDATFDKGLLKVKCEDGGRVVNGELVVRPETYLFGNQAVEHIVALSSVIRKKGGGVFTLVRPFAQSFLEAEVSSDGSEELGDQKVNRYKLTAPSMEARLWIDGDGTLRKFQQGELEVERMKPAKTAD